MDYYISVLESYADSISTTIEVEEDELTLAKVAISIVAVSKIDLEMKRLSQNLVNRFLLLDLLDCVIP